MITEVRYERIFNIGNYENVKVGVTVIVKPPGGPHETDQAMNEAKDAITTEYTKIVNNKPRPAF